MPVRYLLDCRCGQQIVVESTQAGQEVRCACGATQEAPTLLAMRRLPMVAEQSTAEPGWARPQMFSLAGTLLLILAGLATVLAFVKAYPTRPAIAAGPEVIDAQIRELTPVETLQLWENMVRSGVRRPTMLSERKYDEAMSHFYLWLALCGVLAFAGAGVLAQGRWLAVQQKRAAGSTPR